MLTLFGFSNLLSLDVNATFFKECDQINIWIIIFRILGHVPTCFGSKLPHSFVICIFSCLSLSFSLLLSEDEEEKGEGDCGDLFKKRKMYYSNLQEIKLQLYHGTPIIQYLLRFIFHIFNSRIYSSFIPIITIVLGWGRGRGEILAR